jgi:hypothetical protein
LLGLALVALLAGGAWAETAVERPGATPQWDVKAHPSDAGGVHCYYYEPGTLGREMALREAPVQERALRFQKVEKWEPNARVRAFAGEPVREQPLREASLFAAPAKVPRVAEKWAPTQSPTKFEDMFRRPTAWAEGMGRGAMMEMGMRPPTYIAAAQQPVRDFSRFERVGDCLYVRPEFPSALQQVNNRQFSPQWHF